MKKYGINHTSLSQQVALSQSLVCPYVAYQTSQTKKWVFIANLRFADENTNLLKTFIDKDTQAVKSSKDFK